MRLHPAQQYAEWLQKERGLDLHAELDVDGQLYIVEFKNPLDDRVLWRIPAECITSREALALAMPEHLRVDTTLFDVRTTIIRTLFDNGDALERCIQLIPALKDMEKAVSATPLSQQRQADAKGTVVLRKELQRRCLEMIWLIDDVTISHVATLLGIS